MRQVLDRIKEQPELLDEAVTPSAIPHIHRIRNIMDQYERFILDIDQNVLKIDEDIKKAQDWLAHLQKTREQNQRVKQSKIEELNRVMQIVQSPEGEQNVKYTSNRR